MTRNARDPELVARETAHKRLLEKLRRLDQYDVPALSEEARARLENRLRRAYRMLVLEQLGPEAYKLWAARSINMTAEQIEYRRAYHRSIDKARYHRLHPDAKTRSEITADARLHAAERRRARERRYMQNEHYKARHRARIKRYRKTEHGRAMRNAYRRRRAARLRAARGLPPYLPVHPRPPLNEFAVLFAFELARQRHANRKDPRSAADRRASAQRTAARLALIKQLGGKRAYVNWRHRRWAARPENRAKARAAQIAYHAANRDKLNADKRERRRRMNADPVLRERERQRERARLAAMTPEQRKIRRLAARIRYKYNSSNQLAAQRFYQRKMKIEQPEHYREKRRRYKQNRRAKEALLQEWNVPREHWPTYLKALAAMLRDARTDLHL